MALTLLTAASVRAQLTVLSDDRSVSVSGWVEGVNGNVTQSYSQSQSPSAQFGSFAGNTSGNASGLFVNSFITAGSSASQNSYLGPSQLSYSGTVGTSQSFPAPPGHVYSDAFSLFTVSFSVASATPFTLTDNQHNWDMFDTQESFSLRSGGHSILAGPQINSGSEVDQYIGMLDPGQVYTLEVSLDARDFLQPDVTQSLDVTLNTTGISPVPEPSSSLLLGSGAVVAGLLAWRRKRRSQAA